MGASEQERAEGTPLRVELLGVPPKVEEHLLGHLLGWSIGPEDPPGQRVDRPAMATVDLRQGGLVPASHRYDQIRVTRVFHIHHHGAYSEPPTPLDASDAPTPLHGTIGWPLANSKRPAAGWRARNPTQQVRYWRVHVPESGQ